MQHTWGLSHDEVEWYLGKTAQKLFFPKGSGAIKSLHRSMIWFWSDQVPASFNDLIRSPVAYAHKGHVAAQCALSQLRLNIRLWAISLGRAK